MYQDDFHQEFFGQFPRDPSHSLQARVVMEDEEGELLLMMKEEESCQSEA